MNVVVVGAGIIGRACAWRLAQRGVAVTVVDPDPGRAAAGVAAGMLAPVTEAHVGEEALLALNLRSASSWVGFAAELAASVDRTPADLGFVESGTLAVARDGDDRAAHERLVADLDVLGLAVERLSSREIRRREPALGPHVRGGLFVAGDHQVDPRRVRDALEASGARLGVVDQRGAATAVDPGHVTLDDGSVLDADVVVVCAGAASAALVDLPVRPVKGQILRVRRTERALLPRHVLRGIDVYVTPRPDGEIVIGATTEDVGADRTVTAGAVRTLLDEARRLVPGIDEAQLVETSAGLRPTTPDGAPILDTVSGCVVATGHHRHGVLLAPVTADAVAEAVAGDGWPTHVAAFTADRFAHRTGSASETHGREATGIPDRTEPSLSGGRS